MKRLVSIFMALAMIFTSAIVEFPVTTLTVQAAGGVGNSLGSQGAAVAASQAKSYPVNDYPYESDSHIREKDPNDNYESFNHYADAYNFYMGECTSFAAWRIRDVHGINFTNWYGGVQWGDAKNWGNAAEQVHITVDSTPAIGSVGFFTNGRHGHVVWVYGIDGNNVLIEEYNNNEKGWWWSDKYGCCHMYNTRSAPKSSFKYIHFEKLSQKPSTPSEPHGTAMTTGEGYTIPNGEYHITAHKDQQYGITVSGVSHDNGADVDLWNDMHTENHVFIVTYLNNGFYKIINKTTGKSLDVEDASTARGANVQQYEYHGGDCQQWSIKSASDGAYWIRSKCNGWYVDLADEVITPGQGIRMWANSNVYAQGWHFVPWGKTMTSGAGQTISDGEYHITAYKNPEYGVTVRDVSYSNGANIDLWNDMHTTNHVFVITYLNNGFYKIINKTTGKSLDVADASKSQGANVQQYEYHGGDCQQWSIESAGNGVYLIRSKCSGMYLDLWEALIENGTNIQMWEKTDLNAQGWCFIPWGASIGKTIAEDKYIIRWNDSAEIGLTVDAAADNSNVAVYQTEYAGDGYYRIKLNYYAPITLRVTNAKKNIGAGVTVAGDMAIGSATADEDLWIIKPCGSGYYNIISKCSGMYLEKTSSNVLQMAVGNGSDKQRWNFTTYRTPDISVISPITFTEGETLNSVDPKDYLISDGKPVSGTVFWADMDKKMTLTDNGKTFTVFFTDSYRYGDIVEIKVPVIVNPSKPLVVTVVIPKATSGLPNTSNIQIKVTQGNKEIATLPVGADGKLDISSVSYGNFTFTFSANNCAPRSYNVNVQDGNLTGLVNNAAELHLYGDVTGDGRVNSSDVLRAKLQTKGSQKLSDYDFAVADVTKDGKVNSTDILKLKLHAKGSTKLW